MTEEIFFCGRRVRFRAKSSARNTSINGRVQRGMISYPLYSVLFHLPALHTAAAGCLSISHRNFIAQWIGTAFKHSRLVVDSLRQKAHGSR
jgi:hypothetical protein